MQTLLLSICVPNYNQGKALLNSVFNLSSIKQFKEIELIISDNGSTDKESRLALEHAQRLIPGIKILTGPANTRKKDEWFSGFGANLDRLIQNSKGKYIWFLGSGDLIKIEYLPGILDILEKNSFENIVIKSEFYDANHDIDKFLTGSVRESSMLTNSSEDNLILYDNSISCNITHRRVYDEKLNSLKFQDSWPHIEKILIYIAENIDFQVFSIKEPIVIVDQPADGWYTRNDALKIYLELGLLYDYYLTEYKIIEPRVYSQAYTNKILQVVAVIIHIRLSSKSEVQHQLAQKILKKLPKMKAIYLLVMLRAPVFTLKFFRLTNSLLMKI
jgi:glycosyltransferase involved in cell wall biosynthesis